MCEDVVKAGMVAGSDVPLLPTPSQRRPRDPDDGEHAACVTYSSRMILRYQFQGAELNFSKLLTESLDGLPRSAYKRPKLDVTLDEWDLSGLPWWFLGNLRNNYSRRSNGSTDIHTNQVRDLKCLCIDR